MCFKYFLFFTLAAVFISCNKKMELQKLEFDVAAGKSTLALTNTASFSFSGNPDFITFYSGEPGRKYEYRSRTSDTSTNVQMSFSTATTTATNGILSLLVSSDFNGQRDSAGIHTATWTDITDRVKLATGTATVASGTISLADFAAKGKPVYIAFKYEAKAAVSQRKWTVTNFSLNHILQDKTYNIGNMTAVSPSMGWIAIDVKNPGVNWNSALSITGTSAANAVETEDWMLMGPVNLSRVLPDVGVAIKNVSEGMGKFPFTYQYTTPGKYEAVFVAGNVNVSAAETVAKKVSITVE